MSNNVWGNNNGTSPFHVNKSSKDNVKNTDSGTIKNSYSSDNSNQNGNKSKYDNLFSSVRLSIKSIARLNAYQKLNGFKNKIDALNDLLNKVAPKTFKGKKHDEAITLEKIFEHSHKGRSW